MRKFKPIDDKFRKYNGYKKVSLFFYDIYNKFIASENEIKKYYFDNFNKFDVDCDVYFFDCFWGRRIGCNPYALYRELMQRKISGKFVWVKNIGVAIPNDVKSNPDVVFVEHASKDYVKYLLIAKYLFANSNFLPYFVKRKGQVFINTWHGIPLKKLGLDIESSPLLASANTQRNFNISDLISMSGEYADIKTVGAYGSCRNNVRYYGSPRIDMMLSADNDSLRKTLNIKDNKSIILYAPTWRGVIGSVEVGFSIQQDAISTIEKEFPDSHVFVSLHHLTKKHFEDANVTFNEVPAHIDITEFLACVDVLVSDYSSIFIDYLCLDKPVVLYTPDFLDYKRERGLYFELDELPVNYAINQKELIDVLHKLKKPSEFSSYNEIKNSLLFAENGTASKSIIDEMYETSKKGNVDFNNNKINIALYPGGLKNNGITKSFLSLIKNINHDKYCVHVIVDCSGRFGKNKKNNVESIDKRCNLILVSGGLLMSNEELNQLHHYMSSDSSVSSKLDEAFKREARRITNDICFDSVIDFSGYSGRWSLLLSYFNARNKIIFQHSDMLAEALNLKRKHKLFPVFNAYAKFDFLVSVSDELLTINRRKLKNYAQKHKFHSVSNSLDVESIIDGANEQLEVEYSTFYNASQIKGSVDFISISRLSPEKNVDLLIRAFYMATRLTTKYLTLTVVGMGPEFKALQRLTKKLNIEDRVLFAGHQNNPYKFLSRADCLVFPSEYEGQGLVLLEAMVLNKYCIASDIPVLLSTLKGKYGANVALTEEAFSHEIVRFSNAMTKPESFDYQSYIKSSMDDFYNLINHKG